MPDVPNTKLYNFVDTPPPASPTASSGRRRCRSTPTPSSTSPSYRRVNVRIGQTKATSWSLFMGKISGSTLSVENMRPVDNAIHSVEVVGPEIGLWLKGGAPKSREKVQLWVYLRS